MTVWRSLIDNLPIKLLALALAAALWLLATGAKEGVVNISVPVSIRNTPPGLVPAGNMPRRIDVTVSGPKLRLLGLRPEEMSLVLDLTNLGEGTATFSGIEKRLRVPTGVTVMLVYPSVVQVKLVRVSGRGGDRGGALPGVRERAREKHPSQNPL